ncbi:MAG: CpaD family pilus assembly lipoprotein, partial [Alphaproteobacteria bacterium]|nr:CpaD family pilus assembly lipoprotein [Alphaproteobacteria bacterium]
ENKLMEFLAQSGNNPGGNIALLTAMPEDTQTAQRLEDLQRQLDQQGYHEIVVVSDASIPEGRIRVSTSEARVSSPDCPDWSYAHMENYRNARLSNYGCAHAVNLSKMVMDPNDLIAGKGDPRPDVERGRVVIEAYRAPTLTGGDSESSGGGQ